MPPQPIDVSWQVALDDRMAKIVGKGTAVAVPELAHAVHAEVSGLDSSRWYWYQFRVGDELSPIGRTRTLPGANATVDRLRFAFASCQHFEMGYYTAYEHMAAEDLDLVLFLGDYIYEAAGIDRRVRKHAGGELFTLADYRNRYAQYRSDGFLQAAHAAFPWVVVWDDHEVANNYAGVISQRGDPIDAFTKRRAAAYQAYYEHMPLRRSSLPRGSLLQLYRRFTCGTLASFFMLDTRQFRTDQPCGDGIRNPCAGVSDPKATLLGAEQERWLMSGLTGSSTRWNILGQQILMARLDNLSGPRQLLSMDNWNGYDVPRARLLNFLKDRRTANPIVLTGDIHKNWVADLRTDFADPKSPIVATELVGTSISSDGDGADTTEAMKAILADNDCMRFYNGQRGYVSCEISPKTLRAEYRVLDYVSRPGAPRKTRAAFVVENGRPGAVPA